MEPIKKPIDVTIGNVLTVNIYEVVSSDVPLHVLADVIQSVSSTVGWVVDDTIGDAIEVAVSRVVEGEFDDC